MPKREKAVKARPQFTTPRRSPRFLLNEAPKELPQNSRGQELVCPISNACCSENVSKKSRKSSVGSKRKSRVLRNGIQGFSTPRRSSRIADQCKELLVEERNGNPRKSARLMSHMSDMKGKTEPLRIVSDESKAIVEKSVERKVEEGKELEMSGKRKLVENYKINDAVQGWTKEQELDLQRAYLTAKPTPSFWKKVSRLVPGKSAQDCFDKLNSNYQTPPQRHRVSKAKTKHISPISHLELSASKVLRPTEPKHRKPSRQVIHKNARHLLQEQYHQNRVSDADLFSVLEPNSSVEVSTPKQIHEKQGFFFNLNNERSSSGHKKPLSRLGAPFPLLEKVIASPPVLKMVKDKVLHEKYIDQLHIREARRKTASRRAQKHSSGNGNENRNLVLNAKNALVSEAREAITALRQVQSDGMSNDSSDLDCGDESEIEM